MKKKIYEINATELMDNKLKEFKEHLLELANKEVHEILAIDMIDSLIELCYKAGFQDGALGTGEAIQDILRGEAEGPEVNPN
jgi:hypothetical protein